MNKLCLFDMERVLAVAMLAGFALSQATMVTAQAATAQAAMAQPAVALPGANTPAAKSPDVPPLPRGKSTILGGSIHAVDPVRDQLTLDVYGEKPMKILFDERTQVYRDGKRIPLRDLAAAAHASVQTTLDGADIFAVSVHILTSQPQGDYQGRVVSYNPDNGLLVLSPAPGGEPFRVLVSASTSFQRVGQSAFSSLRSGPSDLVPGSLVAVKFDSNNKGQGIATEVSVMAAPGASFIFSGTLSALDLRTGFMTVVDPRDNKSYPIYFDPYAQISRQLHPGQHLRISADYDGTRYVARGITID